MEPYIPTFEISFSKKNDKISDLNYPWDNRRTFPILDCFLENMESFIDLIDSNISNNDPCLVYNVLHIMQKIISLNYKISDILEQSKEGKYSPLLSPKTSLLYLSLYDTCVKK